MVDKVTRVSSSAPSTPTRVDTSLSLAEPEAAWVAHRQSAINAAHEKRKHAADPDGGDAPDRGNDPEAMQPHPADVEHTERLSGESERIGSGNLDEEVPFGEHVGYV